MRPYHSYVRTRWLEPASSSSPLSSMSPRNPIRAVALVLGHLNVTDQQLDTYAQWYLDRNCVVITAASPPFQFVMQRSLRPVAMEVLRQAVVVLREPYGQPQQQEQEQTQEHSLSALAKPATTSTAISDHLIGSFVNPSQSKSSSDGSTDVLPQTHLPLIVHLFSNGGAFLLEEIELLLTSNLDTANNVNSNDGAEVLSTEDRTLLAERMALGYQLFDSCPCYIRMVYDGHRDQQQQNYPITQSFPHVAWSSMTRTVYTLGSALALTTWCTLTLSWHRPYQFWRRMLNSSACQHQIYIYTTADLLSDAYAVDQLIRYRRQRDDHANITTHRFTDGGHCRIMSVHPNEYNAAIDSALIAAEQRAVAAAAHDIPSGTSP